MSKYAAENAHNKGMRKTSLKKKKSKKKKVWTRKADGVYLHKPSGFFYWRPWKVIQGRWTRTWESLDTTSQKIAAERYAKLRYPVEGSAPIPSNGVPAPNPETVTMGQVIRRYIAEGYPDKHKQKRTGQTLDDETSHCEMLLKFWDTVPVDQAGPAACDRYQEWRRKEGFNKGCTGERMVDRELNTLNNACRWGVRCELIKSNPVADRPRYQPASAVKHCREFCPLTTDELHDAIRPLFQHPNSVVLGFQGLTEAMTGLRGKEPLMWGAEAFGKTTEDGKNVHVWRVKGQHANNPFCVVHEGLAAVMKAHAAWKAENYPDRQEYFPSHRGGTIDKGALAHALRRLLKQGKLKRKLTPHGLGRAFYVLVRRSQGATDEQIANEIGHSSNGACIKTTYGGVPESWRNGGGPNMKWLPTNVPVAWAELERKGWKFPKEEPVKLAA